MSHIHIPDGVLPGWIIVLGWLLTGILLVVISRGLKGREARRLPLLGVMAALMIVGMTLEIVPIGYHINLTVLGGIVLGPLLGFLAAFIVDLIIALFGHGGITVVGLNTLVIGAEVALGYYAFRGLWWLIGRSRRAPGLVAGVSTVVSLFLSTLLVIGIVGASNINPIEQAPHAPVEPTTLAFQNPFSAGVLALEVFPEEEAPEETIDLATFAKLVLFLGSIGWVLEAVITGALVAYVFRVRPDLIRPTVDGKD